MELFFCFIFNGEGANTWYLRIARAVLIVPMTLATVFACVVVLALIVLISPFWYIATGDNIFDEM